MFIRKLETGDLGSCYTEDHREYTEFHRGKVRVRLGVWGFKLEKIVWLKFLKEIIR
jgi:hypothetical protein